MARRVGFKWRGAVGRRLLCGAAVALLAGGSQGALARGSVSLDIGVGWPFGVDAGEGFYGPPAFGALTLGAGWHRHPGWHRGYPGYRGYPAYPGYPGWGAGWVFVAPPPAWVAVPAAPWVEPAPAVPTRPDPVIRARQGQDAVQTERDLRDCNRQAVGQPAALADAAVFQRSVQSCMTARGYTMTATE